MPRRTGRVLRSRRVRRPPALDGDRPQGARCLRTRIPAGRSSRHSSRAGDRCQRDRPRAGAVSPGGRAHSGARPDAADRSCCCATTAPRGLARRGASTARGSRRCARPGRTRLRSARSQPARFDGRACPGPQSTGSQRVAVVDRRLRRRADDRCHSPGSPAGPGGQRPAGARRGDGRGHAKATSCSKCTTRASPTAFGTCRLASAHGEHPSPGFRRDSVGQCRFSARCPPHTR